MGSHSLPAQLVYELTTPEPCMNRCDWLISEQLYTLALSTLCNNTVLITSKDACNVTLKAIMS